MKKLTSDLARKSVKELQKEVDTTRQEIARLRLDAKVNPPKDSNAIFKKRKHLAVALSILNERKHQESSKTDNK